MLVIKRSIRLAQRLRANEEPALLDARSIIFALRAISFCYLACKLFLHGCSVSAEAGGRVASGPMIVTLLSCPVVVLAAQPCCQGEILQRTTIGETNLPGRVAGARVDF